MSTNSQIEESLTPTESDIRIAQESIRAIMPHLKQATSSFIRLGENDDQINILLPPAALPLIAEILSEMAKGHPVAVHSLDDEMTAQEAADFLCVSLSFLIGLLDKGEIDYQWAGSQRRLKKAAVLGYDRRRKARGQAALREIVETDQEMGLYE